MWLCAAGLLVLQRVGGAFGSGLDAYDRAATALGRAVLRAGRWVLVQLGPLGRLLRSLARPVWRSLVTLWDWLNVQILLRMFRPLRRFGRWVVARLRPPFERLVAVGRRLVASLEPTLVAVTRAVEAVERTAARLDAAWRRLWAPVLARAAGWRRRQQLTRRRQNWTKGVVSSIVMRTATSSRSSPASRATSTPAPATTPQVARRGSAAPLAARGRSRSDPCSAES